MGPLAWEIIKTLKSDPQYNYGWEQILLQQHKKWMQKLMQQK